MTENIYQNISFATEYINVFNLVRMKEFIATVLIYISILFTRLVPMYRRDDLIDTTGFIFYMAFIVFF